jgi:gamma-glutamyltranspeptidase/glutathione hydrolase
VQGRYAEALTLVSQEGEKALHGGAARRPAGRMHGEDRRLRAPRRPHRLQAVEERAPIRGHYRGWEILGPPPPAASGVHIAQMLNILEAYDIAKMGFGTVDTLHLLAEVLKIAFADRAEASGDPDFVKVPVERIVEGLCRPAPQAPGHRARHAVDGRAAAAKAPTPRISPWPTARATSSARRRPSTACSARASSCPAPA